MESIWAMNRSLRIVDGCSLSPVVLEGFPTPHMEQCKCRQINACSCQNLPKVSVIVGLGGQFSGSLVVGAVVRVPVGAVSRISGTGTHNNGCTLNHVSSHHNG